MLLTSSRLQKITSVLGAVVMGLRSAGMLYDLWLKLHFRHLTVFFARGRCGLCVLL